MTTEADNIPRGIEILVMKAAVDPPFRSRLVERRSAAADEIGLVLTDAEKAVIDNIPAPQLKSTIASAKVDSRLIPILVAGTAAAILAALGIAYMFRSGLIDALQQQIKGIRPDPAPINRVIEPSRPEQPRLVILDEFDSSLPSLKRPAGPTEGNNVNPV